MKRVVIALGLAAMALGTSAPALADHASGEVQEIIIKVKTKDGERWYRLGKDLERIDIREGDYVHFDYADDVIEAIEPEAPVPETPETPEDAPKTSE